MFVCHVFPEYEVNNDNTLFIGSLAVALKGSLINVHETFSEKTR